MKALPPGPRFRPGEVCLLFADTPNEMKMAVWRIEYKDDRLQYILADFNNKKQAFSYQRENDIGKYKEGRFLHRAIAMELKRRSQGIENSQRKSVHPPGSVCYNIGSKEQQRLFSEASEGGQIMAKGSAEAAAVEEKPSKSKKAPVPEGKIKPVELAKELEIRPQIVYGWIRTGGLPTETLEDGHLVLDRATFEQWYEEKQAKKVAREAAKAEKAAKAAAKGESGEVEAID